jgi:hypothetical protein
MKTSQPTLLDHAMRENDELRQQNEELIAALKALQGMGLGRDAYAICTEAIAKFSNK